MHSMKQIKTNMTQIQQWYKPQIIQELNKSN